MKYRQLLTIWFFAIYPHFLFGMDISNLYSDSGVILGKKVAMEKICGSRSKLLKKMDDKLGNYNMVQCTPPTKEVDSMTVAHLEGIPAQIILIYNKSSQRIPASFTGKPNVLVIEDKINTSGLRVISGVTSNDSQKMENLNTAGFILMGAKEKITTFAITDCNMTWAEENMRGLYNACVKGREALK